MPFHSESDTATRDRLYQDGTLQPDGSDWFAGWPSLPGAGGMFGGFSGLYPYPSVGPSWDGIVPAWHGLADAATDAPTPGDAATSGTAGTARNSGGGTNPAAVPNPAGSVLVTQDQSGADPTGLVINAIFDTSIVHSNSAAAIENAVSAAISFYEAEITTNVTLNIEFSYGSIDGKTLEAGALSESDTFVDQYSYSTLEPALEAHDTTIAGASLLPTSDPFAPGDTYYVATAEEQALGLLPSSGIISPGTTLLDGYVALAKNVSFDYSTTATTVPSNEYDAVGALEHEISEVMGRIAVYIPAGTTLTGTTTATANTYSPLDLFRYTGAGTLANNGTASYFSTDGGTTNLAEFNNAVAYGGDPGDWSSPSSGGIDPVADDSYDAFSNPGALNTVSATDLTVLDMLGYSLAAACYAAGTRILAAQGEMPIEQLAVGDRVRTRFGGVVPIRWIGQRSVNCRHHRDPSQVWPVRIAANSFGAGRPQRDLLLSPDHAVAVDGALIPIRLLMNGGSIRQETGTAAVRYFHLELDRHDLLWAENLEAESYLDTGNRTMFANAGTDNAPDADPDAQRRRETGSCLPLLIAPVQVEPIWNRLAARSVQLGLPLPLVATTPDPALCLAAGQRRFAPVLHDGRCYTFVLPPLPEGTRLQSRAAVPSALRPWLEDRRRLGVMVHRLSLRRGSETIDIALDDPRLAGGWWAPEYASESIWRWTDGDAVLPSFDGPCILTVALGEALPYPLAEPASAGTALPTLSAGFLPEGVSSMAASRAPAPHSVPFW